MAAATSSAKLLLYHVPRFRSSRALWMYYELKHIYGDRIPKLDVVKFEPESFRVSKPKAFLEHNPNGKVPTLVHDDIVLWDSCAICLYMLDNFDLDHVLAPKSPQFRAKLYKLMFYLSGTVDNLTATSSPVQMVMENKKPGNDPDLIEKNKQAYLTLCGPLLSAELGTALWMGGESFSALDVVFGYNMETVHNKRGWYDEKLENLTVWHSRVKTRPMYVKAFADDCQ